MDKQAILDAIDCDEWKHSWHLPRDQNGYINFYSSRTLEECQKIIQGKINSTIDRLTMLQKAQNEVNNQLSP